MMPMPKLFTSVARCVPEGCLRSSIAALASFVLLSVASQVPSQAQALHPIVGTWSWTLFAGKCQETFQFKPDGTLLTTSGDAVAEWTYKITPQASETNFYPLRMLLTRQNGKKDCYGDVAEEGREIESFIQMSPAKDRFINCKSASLAACFGPLGKIP
jgi:hypothetical protein